MKANPKMPAALPLARAMAVPVPAVQAVKPVAAAHPIRNLKHFAHPPRKGK